MMTKDEALKLALEALDGLSEPYDVLKAQEAIREALAQQEDPCKGANYSQASEQESVAWRDHVEQRLLTWRQSFVNRSGDQLALDDFMDKRSLDDLVEFVCDEYATPPQPEQSQVEETLRYEIDALETKLAECRAHQQEPVIDKSAAIRIATALGWEPKRTWQGLTDEELAEFSEAKLGAYDLCLEVEAKLKEKNT